MSASSTARISLRGVSKYFETEHETVQAVVDASLDVHEGEFVTLLGPSGCGKSTLFNIIAGLIPQSSGEILLNGEPVSGTRGLVGYMLQKDLLLPWRTVLDNVTLGLELQGIRRHERYARALPILERYGLHGFEHHYPASLSGGMRQRTALIRTILYDREIVLLDEPFGALDAQTRSVMQEWLLDIWQEFRKTILFITHDVEESVFLSDRVYVMTARPGRMKAAVDIPLPRPRHGNVVTSEEFIRLKRHLLDLIREETAKSMAASGEEK